MADFVFKIGDSISNHEDVLKRCDDMVKHFIANPHSNIVMDFRRLNFIYPDYALMILCSLKYLENIGINVTGTIKYSEGSTAITYLSKMQFFNNLNVAVPNAFNNLYPHSFVQIQEYTEENQLEVLKSILEMLRVNGNIDANVYAGLDYCFNEILDNVLNHSTVDKGWVVAQYFPNLNTIRLMVCDFGVGIKEALKEKYNFNEEDALLKCIQEGITNGKGQGHGLFATSRFIEMNKGWLSIISGNKKLDLSETKADVCTIPYWKGTCVYLRINTNIDVDYTKFTGKHYDYKEYIFESMFK